MINKIHNINCLDGLRMLSDMSVDCVVTSPPYWGLRDYGVDEQLGLEDSLQEYIYKIVKIFREIKRVLRDDGTIWLNLGDSYVGTGGDRKKAVLNPIFNQQQSHNPKNGRYDRIKKLEQYNLKPKDLIGIPWRVAFALQDDGWYLRSDIIWHKPNCMPESVKDRPTKAHEYIFLLSKSRSYYYDHEAVKEDCVNGDPNPPRGSKGNKLPNKGLRKTFRGGGKYTKGQSFDNTAVVEAESKGNKANPLLKRNRRSVWTIATAQHKETHFATFPEKLIEPCIVAGCPIEGIVLDPFMGSGTVGKVSIENNRNFIGFELNKEYCRIADKRIQNVQNRII